MKPSQDKKRLLLIELNEFSVQLLQRGISELGLPNVQRLLAMKATQTTTDDEVEHRGLDPWVQWVSAHTGVPSTVHGIIHLGDAPSKLRVKQVWEVLSDAGISSGVWGAMNATREGARHCAFFLPDPWTFSEEAYPDELNGLLSLPRYYSKNYLDVSFAEFAKRTLRLAGFILGSGAVLRILGKAPFVLSGVLRGGVNNATLFSLFDLFSTCIYVGYKKRHDPQFSLIFLNSIAHLQHHKWNPDGPLGKDLRFGLRTIDLVLGMLFDAMQPGEGLVVMNALTQENIANGKPRICYRQINPAKFLAEVGFTFRSVEQLMTNDAHVFFDTDADLELATRELSAARILGEPLFDVDAKEKDRRKLFYQVDFWDELDQDVKLVINGREINFLDHFEAIVARTGAHVQEGNLFSAGLEMPATMYNHAVADKVLAYFGLAAPAFAPDASPQAAPLPAAGPERAGA